MNELPRLGVAGVVVGLCVLGAAMLGAGGCSFGSSSPSSGAPDAHFGTDGPGFEASAPDGGGGTGDTGTGTEAGGHEGGAEGGGGDGGGSGCSGGGGPGTWTCIGDMGTARTAPGVAALPGGKALVAGGWNATDKVLLSAEVYDPVNQTFTPTGSMTSAHLWGGWGLTWPVVGGKVLAAGGLDGSGALVGASELYHPAAGTFTATGSLVTPVISMFPVVLNDGSALFVGGWNSTTGAPPTPGWQFFGDGTSEVQRFSSTGATWADTGALAEHRLVGCNVVLPNGHVLAVGGGTGPSSEEQNIEDYDPTAGTWTSVGTLTIPGCTVAFRLPGGTGNGKVLLLADGSSASADILDTSTYTTTPTTGFPAGWGAGYAQLPSGDVVAFGGTLNSAGTAKTMVFHASGTSWTATADMGEVRTGSYAATVLTTGEILVVGGSDASGAVLKTAELYHP